MRLNLFAAYLRGSEAENAGAPRPTGEPSAGIAEQLLGVVAAEQGQREEGQGAVGRHGFGEGGRIADARHRPLHDGIASPVPLGEPRSLGQRKHAPRCLNLPGDALAERLHDAADGAVTVGQRFGEGGVLTDRPQVALGVRADALADSPAPLVKALGD